MFGKDDYTNYAPKTRFSDSDEIIHYSKLEKLRANEWMLGHKHTLNGREQESVMGS